MADPQFGISGPDPRLYKIKANVKKMVDQGAPEADIEDYLRAERVSDETLRGIPTPQTKLSEDERKYVDNPLLRNLVTFRNALIPGANKIGAMGGAVVDSMMMRPGSLSDNYGARLQQQERIQDAIEKDFGYVDAPARALGWFLGGAGLAKAIPEAAGVGLAKVGEAGAPVLEAAKQSMRLGGGFGAVQGGLDSRATDLPGTVLDTGLGLVGGGALGYATPLAVQAGAQIKDSLGGLARTITGRSPVTQEFIDAQRRMWSDAMVKPFGPAMTDNPVHQSTGRGLTGSVLGEPLRRSATRSIDDVLAGAQKAIRSGAGDMSLSDLGDEVQQGLRRALTARDIPPSRLAQMATEELEGITGPVNRMGFETPRPVVPPIDPEPVPIVRPRQIDSDTIPRPRVDPDVVPFPKDKVKYKTIEEVPYRQEHERVLGETQMKLDLAEANWERATQDFNAAAKRLGMKPQELYGRSMTPVLDGFSATPTPAPEGELAQAMLRASNEVSILKDAMKIARMEADKVRREDWIAMARKDHAAHQQSLMDRHTAEVQRAKEAAETRAKQMHEEAVRAAQAKETEAALARTAELEFTAKMQAEEARRMAQMKADATWRRERETNPGFKVGRTPHSYQTELAAAIERVARETPKFQRNPLGGEGPSGATYRTATQGLIDEIGLEARRLGQLKGYREGRPFGDDGRLFPGLDQILDDRFGADVSRIIKGLADARARRGFAPGLQGIRDFRTSVRQAADAAERPPYPGLPRKEEAATLRRLEKALSDDLYKFLDEAGPEGQTAAKMWRNVDNQYGQIYIKALRQPLAKVFGEGVPPLDAMNRLATAAIDGDLRIIRPFMRVAREKGDPRQAAMAIIATATKRAATLDDFLQGMASIPRESRREMFAFKGGEQLLAQLNRLEVIGKRLQPFNERSLSGVTLAGRRLDLTNPANVALGLTAMSNFYATMFAAAGAAGMSRFMASPRYMRWLLASPAMKSRAQWQRHVTQLVNFASGDAELGEHIVNSAMATLKFAAPGAQAKEVGNPQPPPAKPGLRQEPSPFQPILDAAQSKGIDYRTAKPEDVLDAAWATTPSDEMADMIEKAAEHFGILPPWKRGK